MACLVQYSPDGRQLAVVAADIKVWDAQTWQLQYKFSVNGRPSNGVSVCFSPDGRTLAAFRLLWSDPFAGCKRRPRIHGFDGTIECSDTSDDLQPDGSQLAVLSGRRTGSIWHLDKLQAEHEHRELGWADAQAGIHLSGTAPTLADSTASSGDSSLMSGQRFKVSLCFR